MGTRAVITFSDEFGNYSVYQHWDGNPETVIENIRTAKHHWPMPRFEADEYAASYVATHKTSEGNIRLTKGPRAHGDLAYVYTVTRDKYANYLTVTYRSMEQRAKKHVRIVNPEA